MLIIDQTILIPCVATGILGSIAGIIGCWLFLQQKNLYGDTISHATLPGIAGIFLITHLKHPLVLLLGGVGSALIAAYFIETIKRRTLLKNDTVLGLVLASSFGLGTILLTKVQSMTDAHHAGLSKYLMGNPATILREDLVMIALGSMVTLIFTARFIKPYAITLFDPIYASTVGIHTRMLSWIMLIPTTITIVFGLQAVGIILMSALLINPAASAYQWTKKFTYMMLLASFFGAISAVIGTLVSCTYEQIPTGPMIVIVATTLTALSILMGPQGIIVAWYTQSKKRQSISQATLLSRFLLFNEGKHDPFHPHNIAALAVIGKAISQQDLDLLEKNGFIEMPKPQFWRLTQKGIRLLHESCRIKQ